MLFEANNLVELYRLVESNGKKNFSIIKNNIKVYIYSFSDDMAMLNDVEAGQETYKMMTQYEGIKTGDKLIDSNGNNYIVDRVNHLKSIIGNHFEMLIHKQYD